MLRMSFLEEEKRPFQLAGPVLFCFRALADPPDSSQSPGPLPWTADVRLAQLLGERLHRRLILNLVLEGVFDGSLHTERVMHIYADDRAFRRWLRALVLAASPQVGDH